jgi:3-oxoadipate enol-lactonase
MPFADIGELHVHHALTGAAGALVVVLSNSLGTDFSMWDPQVPALEKQFRVLRYDTRGHGQTAVTPGPYTIEQLARDVLGLLDKLGLDRVHFCGLSMGGMIGMWLGMHAGERLHKLVLCNTAARIGTVEAWNARIENIRKAGMKAVAPAVAERWLTPEFRRWSPRVAAETQRMIERSPLEGYVACCAAVRDTDERETVSAIRVPTLVIAGRKDPATPPADVRYLADRIAGAEYVELETAHLSNLEGATQFTSELIRFLTA